MPTARAGDDNGGPGSKLRFDVRGALIVRRLCVLLGAEKVYREFSTILESESDLDFASTMVQALNLILLTSAELGELRSLLKKPLVDSCGKDLFQSLYASWHHSPMVTISLCLLSQVCHASCVIQSLGEDINVKFLVQLDKLIRLLETPVVANLRLQEEYEKLTFPLATCIVMSVIYEDDLDKADEFIYTGQGGNDLLGNHCQIDSQQLKRGNLALKNSRDNGSPVRVIRGHFSKNSYTGKVYTYDGLYKVVDDWVQNGVQGHVVFKYKLKRLEGQPSLTTSEVTRAEAPTTISELPGYWSVATSLRARKNSNSSY
ncbi:hypothetical protein ACP4OV_010513 [Aristida adscensionis]